MRWTPENVTAFLRAVGEPFLALSVAFLLTGLLTLPFIPMANTVEVPVPHGDESDRGIAERELLGEFDDNGLPSAGIELVTRSGDKRVLLLRGLSDEQVSLVRSVLDGAGHDSSDIEVHRTADFELMLSGESGRLPTMLSIQAVIFLLLGVVLSRVRVRGGRESAAVFRASMVGVVAGVAAVLVSVVISAGLRLLDLPVEEQDWLTELFSDPGALLRIAPWVVLVGPIAEEVFFRGYVFRFISEQIGFPAGLIISSLMFAAIHFNFSGLLVYLGIGAVLAYGYHRTGSIVTPIVGHVVTNGIVLIVSGLAANPDL